VGVVQGHSLGWLLDRTTMEELGTELFEIIVQIYPELAPKLTGMLMQLGEEECIACLESQEKLAERLDEAFRILDASGQQTKGASQEEKRIDPEDGKARTLTELRALCKGTYSPKEIEAYWATMKPEKATAKAAAPKAVAAARSPPEPAARSAAPAAPAATVAAPAAAIAAPGAAATDEAIAGLSTWLRQLKLDSYSAAATEWAEEEGACSLEEIIENLEDFADGLKLKPLERKRLVQGAEEAAAKVSQEAAVASPAPAEAAEAGPPMEEPDDPKAEQRQASVAAAPDANVEVSESGHGAAADDGFPALGADLQAAGKRGKKKR